MGDSDNKVIEEIINGDVAAYATIVNRYKDKVYSLVFGILRNETVAEEVAQDVFVKAYAALKKFRRESSFSTWIYRITYNAAISETRKKRHKIHSFDEQLEKSSSMDFSRLIETEEENELKKELLHRAIDNLQAEERLILMLFYFEEQSIEEISISSGLSKSNVKVKLHRLRSKLKNILVSMGIKELAVY